MDYSQYDFIDFGASRGGAIEFAKARLGGKLGVGVDLNPKKVAAMKALGYECVQGDITQLGHIPDKNFRFTVMSHVLEHLKDQEDCYLALKEAQRISRDFIYIQGPYFERDEWLKNQGFRLNWSFWRCHSYHVTSDSLKEIAKRLGLGPIKVYAWGPVKNSSHKLIHPLTSPINQYDYDEKVHPPKKFMVFKKPIYREIITLIPLRPLTEIEDLPNVTTFRKDMVLTEESEEHSLISFLKEWMTYYLMNAPLKLLAKLK